MSLYEKLKKNREQRRAELEARESEPVQKNGFLMPIEIYEDEKLKKAKWNYAVASATRIAMSTIANAVERVGWEKYLDAMERLQWPSVEKRAEALAKRFGYEDNGGTMLDCKLHTLTWSRGCGWKPGSSVLYDFGPDHVEAGSNWCPQIECLKEMGLIDTIDDLGVWCDAFDALIMNYIQPKTRYCHCYCLHHDPVCIQSLDMNKDGGVLHGRINGNPRKEGEESLYHAILRQKADNRGKIQPIVDHGTPSIKMPPWLDNWTEDEIARRGCETKFHIATDNILLAGETLGWEDFINTIGEKQTYGLTNAAQQKRFDFHLLGTNLKTAAALVTIGWAGLPFTHMVTKYHDDQIEGIAHRCPIVEAAREMGLDHVEDLSLWCDFYKNFEVHAVNPGCQMTHTHCMARGDKYCRFIIE